MITALILETSWDQLKRQLKHKFGGLLYADLAYTESRQDLMFKNLQIKLRKSETELKGIIAAL